MSIPPSFPFSAVLLAGGRSTRMGRDKAEILLPDGRPLWRRQLDDVLRPLGPAEIFLSGPARGGLPADVRVLPDAVPGLGPLSGIAAALGAAGTPLVAVLAVDLPAMTPEFFRSLLLPGCTAESGAVGVGTDGFYEPLAAIYPRVAHGLAGERLRGTDRSLQGFVREAIRLGILARVTLRTEDAGCFANWNRPGGPEIGRPPKGDSLLEQRRQLQERFPHPPDQRDTDDGPVDDGLDGGGGSGGGVVFVHGEQ